MKDCVFKLEVEDEHLDNFLFLLLLIAAKCPKSLKRPYNLKDYISYISRKDLSKSVLLNENPTLKYMFEELIKGNSFKPADNIKLELNKEFHKRIKFYDYYLQNAVLEVLSIIFSPLSIFITFEYGIFLVKEFSLPLFCVFGISFLLSIFFTSCLFVSDGNINTLLNLSSNKMDDRILFQIFNKIKIKSRNIKKTFRYLPVSRKSLFRNLEKERQSMKKNEPVIIEKVIEVEKIVEIEKDLPYIYSEVNITSADYMESNKTLQKLFQEFSKFRDLYPILCSEIPEKRKEAFISYNIQKQRLQWNGDQQSIVYLFFRICKTEYGMSESAFNPIVDTFLNKSGQPLSSHQLKVVENKDETSKDTAILSDFLEKLVS